MAALLERGVDWTDLVRLALAHGATPLLGAGLRGAPGEAVPPEIREALAVHLADDAERSAALARELFALVEALERRGVRAIPFKGPTLAELAFGDRALRRAGDLDLLVRPEDVDPTCAVLREAGYREQVEYTTGRPLSPAENAAYLRYQCEYLFLRPRDGLVVEPHWALAPPGLGLSLDLAGFWSRARPRRFEGGTLWSLALEDLLLALCVHAAKHEWEELRWVVDVAALRARHPELDLELARDRARAQHCERILALGLELARALLDAPLPARTRAWLEGDAAVGELARRVTRRLVRGGPRPPQVFALSGLRLRMLDRRRDRVRSVLRTLTTPQLDHLRTLPLPTPLFFLHPALKVLHDYLALPLWWPLRWSWTAARRRLRARRGRRLLVVDWVPHVTEGAGFPRMNALLHLLARRGWAVTLHPVLPCEEPDGRLYADLPGSLRVVRGQGLERIDAFLREHAGDFPTLLVCRPPAMRRLAEVFAREPGLREGVRLVYDAEAVFALREIRRREVLGEPLEPEAARRAVADECDLASGVDAVIAASRGEAEVFRRHGAKRVVVLPYAVRARPTPRPFAERHGLLFVGRLAEDDWPNTDGMVWFLDHALTRVRAALGAPEDEPLLRAAGMTGARRLAERRDPGLELLGVVPDLGPLYDRARVFIAPTRFSAGTPAKVYEAAAHGVPVVATRALADQLGWEPGRDLLAADAADPAGFADRVVALHTDAGLWARVREAALARVAAECGPERAAATLEAALVGGPGEGRG